MNRAVTTLVRGASGLARSLLAIFGAALAVETRNDERQLYDTDLIGEYNHRTGRLDAGNDPYGWYDED
ncbi:MAG: hypothetical protein H6965_10150 [Chromatiaceae bacterium]|nr:hypothetical protein [Chromatiaceae bacterium]